MEFFIRILFYIDSLLNLVILLGAVWSIGYPKKRIWPPPQKYSWQFNISWLLFSLIFLINAVLVVLDWNTWIIADSIRFYLGIPLIVIGIIIVSAGIYTLGIVNTSGIKNGLVTVGIYRYTRNPQYLGDILLFIGISLLANSLFTLVVHMILIVTFLILPLCEEKWLEQQYGEQYIRYKTQ